MGNLVELLNSLVNQINELQLKLVDSQKAAEELAKAEYDRGFADGVASVGQGDKIYTQEDMDNAIKNAVEPLNVKISELEAVVAGMDAKIEEAKISLKAELMAKFLELKAKEDAVEVEFEGFLK